MPRYALGPVAAEDRIEFIDVLRGFTLFGILVANWRGFAWPAEFYTAPSAVLKSPADLYAQTVVDLFFGNKFISILSVLFGIGFAIQFERATERGARFLPVITRRLGTLFAMGIAHGLLLWWGDILATYAAAGLLLLAFHRLSRCALLGWAAALLTLPLFHTVWRILAARPSTAAAPRLSPAEVVERASNAYLQGSWFDLQRQLVHDWKVNNADAYFTVLYALAWFLVGVTIWRSGFLLCLRDEVPRLKRIGMWGLLLGAGGGIGVLVIRQLYQPRIAKLPLLLLATQLVRLVAAPLLSAGYVAAVAMLVSSGRAAWLRRSLAAVGRTSLSNYLLQSVIGTAIHYGYGLGMYAKVGAVAGLGMSVAVFAAQLPLSLWYSKRFRYGPAEWLWRSVTYWHLEPFSRRASAS